MVKENYKKIINMLKLVKIPVWTIILALFGLIGSLTAYAYTRDTKKIDENSLKIESIEKSYVSKEELNSAFIDHYKIHELEQSRHNDLKEYISEKNEDLKEYIDLAISKSK